GAGGGGGGPDPSAQCLYPELVPPSYGPHSGYQDPGLAGSEVFSRLLGPADWPPDSACGSQATDHYFKVPESSWVPFECWPGSEVAPGAEVPMPGYEQPPPGAAGQVPGCQGAPHQSRLQCPGGDPCYRAPPILDPLRPGPGLFARLQPSPGSCSPPPPSPALRPDTPRGESQSRRSLDTWAPSREAAERAGGWEPRHLGSVGAEGSRLHSPPKEPRLPGAGGAQTPGSLGVEQELGGESRESLDPLNPSPLLAVEALLDVACSSAVPGGGTNRELALHCLCRTHGDVRAALEMLLLQNPAWPPQHSLSTYHYTGSDAWTPHERRQFAKAFAQHGKDFALIQRAVPAKGLQQCVEFYYLHKSRLGRGQKRQGPSEALDMAPSTCFPCQRCGRSFVKIKSRNAHMKIHRLHQPTGEGPRPLPLPPQQCLL
ncbi:zinc finger protein 541-like, partial [Alligator sinensis]|uniref:Zinc finger protein 541-like n=1 Tax=Alligator sinensis TaxID=38654 RepID=A0A3Q0HFH5_ALLSI